MPHEELLQHVWPEVSEVAAMRRSLHVHIRWLRAKLCTRAPIGIVSVRGLGYRLDCLTPAGDARQADDQQSS